jgi:hypothetical protein
MANAAGAFPIRPLVVEAVLGAALVDPEDQLQVTIVVG